MPEDVHQNIVFNITGQGVTNRWAVGARLNEFLNKLYIDYDHVWVQNSAEIFSVR